MSTSLSKTTFEFSLADDMELTQTVTPSLAEDIFNFFKNATLFRWKDANNDCEDRANAITLILDKWGVPNCKGWVFSGAFLRKDYGTLDNLWNYHVAAVLPVNVKGKTDYLVIDPATSKKLITVEEWASNITFQPNSYYFIRHGHYYIFPSAMAAKNLWFKRNKRNHRWTMQGLSGINAVSQKGKTQLAFFKKKPLITKKAFYSLMYSNPGFLHATKA